MRYEDTTLTILLTLAIIAYVTMRAVETRLLQKPAQSRKPARRNVGAYVVLAVEFMVSAQKPGGRGGDILP